MTTQKPPKLCPSTLQRSTPELVPDELGVADDRVGAEVRQVLGLLLGLIPSSRRRPASSGRAALVEEQDPVVLERTASHALSTSAAAAATRSRAALEEDEPRQLVVLLVGRDDLAREDRQLAASGLAWSSGTSNSCSPKTGIGRTVGCDAHTGDYVQARS